MSALISASSASSAQIGANTALSYELGAGFQWSLVCFVLVPLRNEPVIGSQIGLPSASRSFALKVVVALMSLCWLPGGAESYWLDTHGWTDDPDDPAAYMCDGNFATVT
jgi:hypothetical protein